MCLCIYQTLTFSNKTAFRRLEYELNKLNERLENKCYPQGIVYIIKKLDFHTLEGRDRLPYEELVTQTELGFIETEHLHFSGWEEYKKTRKQVGDRDVFGEIRVKVQ